MDNKHIEQSVNEVIEDLKHKVDDICEASESDNLQLQDRLYEVKSKAVDILRLAAAKIYDALDNLVDEQDLYQGLELTKVKSKQLYETTMAKIQQIKNSESVNKKVEKIKKGSKKIVSNAKRSVNELLESEQFKHNVNNAKAVTVEVAEQVLDTLKEWLLPESEDK